MSDGESRQADVALADPLMTHRCTRSEYMRDDSGDYSDYDDSRAESRARRGLDGLQTLALLGALALIVTPALKSISRRWRVRQPAAALSEPAIDKSLKDTFPASDPPASRYFDIPENRK
jgi:hypothetical protein